METVNIALLGLGTVGGGTLQILGRHADAIERRTGRRVQVRRALVRDPAKARPAAAEGVAITTSIDDILNDASIHIVAELMGGCEPAREWVLRAIAGGKHVITANKALIAQHGNEIFAAAEKHGVIVAFEAAVGGGIPIIKTIREALAGNDIRSVAGIVNGTTNYILTEMRDRGLDFGAALAEAQALGYAEADPSFDVGGIDAAHKLAILAAIAFGTPLSFPHVAIEGIEAIGAEDIHYADTLGYSIKHLAIARRDADAVELRVHPTLIPQRHLLARVDGVMNAILVEGDAVGESLLYGAGAGALPTASSVVADVVDVLRLLSADPDHRVPYLGVRPGAVTDLPVRPLAAIHSAYYLRLGVEDHPGVMADITRILAEHAISIEAMLQRPDPARPDTMPIILLTHRVWERAMDEALDAIAQLPSVRGPITRIRVHTDGAC